MKNTAFNLKPIRVFLILSLLLQAGFATALSSFKMEKMQSYATSDTLLICTGKTVKWISASHFFETGEVLEVIPDVSEPSAVLSDLQSSDCVFSIVADHQQSLIFDNYSSETFDNQIELIDDTYSLTPSTRKYQKKARAPPAFTLI